ncbi:hypothetical protein [Ascidiimonas sp. W6]|uniref:hypothetical protein n=1 Tax=Ascidiimonas meishanensis TaxID=3128903 RepID=UPI0030ED29EF
MDEIQPKKILEFSQFIERKGNLKMDKLVATTIKTKKWYSIIASLKKDGWKVVTEYNHFDKGIDFDLYELEQNDEKILFVWDNWFEGEIKCNKERMRSLENSFETEFTFGEPENISDNLIDKIKSLLIKR